MPPDDPETERAHDWLRRARHDIEELGKSLENGGLAIPSVVRDAVILTRYAVETRYPGPTEPVSREEYEEAVRLAQGIVVWSETAIAE